MTIGMARSSSRPLSRKFRAEQLLPRGHTAPSVTRCQLLPNRPDNGDVAAAPEVSTSTLPVR